MPPALQFLVLTFAGWVNRHQDDLIAYLREENRVLREHLGPRPLRLTDAQRRRLAVRGQKLGRRVLMQVAGIVTPDTILRWYRRLIAQTYDGSARRGRGRPMTRRDVAALVVRMAVENPQWGYTRIRGALSNLGHEIARTTVKRILHDHGIDPAPERSRRMPWKTFLQAHWETTYSATSTEHDVPRDAASVATAPERRSWMSASPVTSVRRQPPRTVRERPRPSARMVTGLSSATPQSSDSPTHMIQSVDASASQKTSPLVRPSGRRPRVSSARATRRRPCRPLFRVAPRTPFGCGGTDIDTTPGTPGRRSRTLGTGERRPR